jgi:DNA topoisomerase-1
VTAEERIREIAEKAERILKKDGFADKFYDYMSRGYYSLASPVWSNFGLAKGFPISCFSSYIGDTFTADMEDKLDLIAEGKATYLKTLKDFYGPFIKEVKSKDSLEKATSMGDAPEGMICPLCSANMVIKLAKNGKFYSCSRYPDCVGARKMDGSVMEGPKKLGKPCPKCGKGELMEREGRYGKFIACDNYPKCKYIEQDEELRKANSTGVHCNKCKDGYMEERKGRFGIFYSCSNYPNCKHIVKTKPTGNRCPYIKADGTKCDELMMEGTKTIPERCSDKTCPNHNPHKLDTSKAK